MGPPSTTKLPDLVHDSKLETTFSKEEWKRQGPIGSGGNGVVWLEERVTASSEEGNQAEGNQAQRRAVKQIILSQAQSTSEIRKYELEALAKFSAKKYSQCFVEFLGWYESSRSLFIAMEYCPLGDLRQYLVEHTMVAESDTCEIIGQVAQGLQFMHKEGFAHRDLKPGNILIMSHPPGDKWWVKICDMGLSKRIEEAGAATTAVKGTPGFFAPEQLGLGGTDPKMADPFKTDIWCLGEMTFQMLRGEAVFPSHDDLRRYYQGTIMFPKERLYKIKSRPDAQQAFNHEWLMTVNNDLKVGEKDPRADEIESQGNEDIRARRKTLIDQVNVMLDKLESARKRFDEQDKEQQGAAKLRLQSQHGSAREERQKERKDTDAKKRRYRPILEETSDSSDSSDRDVIYEPKPDKKKSRSGRKSRDIDPSSTSDRARKYSCNLEEAVRFLTGLGANGVPSFTYAETFRPELHDMTDSEPPLRRSRASRSSPTAGFDERGDTRGSWSDNEVVYRPRPPRKAPFTNRTQTGQFYDNLTPWEPPFGSYEFYGRLPPPPRPPAEFNGVSGKVPDGGLSYWSILAWLDGVMGKERH
ncbi:hypothetical protein NUW58_g517 [Xylaria curta]|uniref:Uncharacterized protein n=1 Tax=Xylaria curta TaxID=42375 RepID=A0ACC1PNY6_9PEZI|nr:hypothetical protein NUW58_g517 [Xylaria curta]